MTGRFAPAAPLLLLALAPLPASAEAVTSPFGAYIAGGDASCLEVTVATGYSFVVEPDARLPRATAAIGEGTSGALASPADPGDSVDALSGLMVPREEGQVTGQMPQGTGTALQQVLDPVNPHLEYPYEHAAAQYPNPQQPGDQQASLLGAPSASFADPSGVVSVDGTAGSAAATATSAAAEAGAGAAASLPPLGVATGRVAANDTAQLTADRVENDATCTLQDVTVAPPGSGFSLHIGTLAAALHTERRIGAATATSTHTMQLGDVTVDGRDVLPAGQGGVSIPATAVSLPQPPAIPGVPAPVSLDSVALSGTSSTSALASSGNEVTSRLVGATIVITSTAPVPSSIPPAPGQNPVSATPVVYTIQLGALDAQAYGLPQTAPPAAGAAGAGSAGALSGGPGTPSSLHGSFGSLGGGPGGRGGAVHRVTPNRSGAPAAASLLRIPGMPGPLRWGVVALALLAEAALLTALWLRHRRLGATPLRAAPPPSAFLDLP